MGYIIFSRVTNVIFGKFSCSIRSVPTSAHSLPWETWKRIRKLKKDHSRPHCCSFWNVVRSTLTETAPDESTRLQRQKQPWAEQWLCTFILHGNLVPRAFVTLISFRRTRVTGRLWKRDCVHYRRMLIAHVSLSVVFQCSRFRQSRFIDLGFLWLTLTWSPQISSWRC